MKILYTYFRNLAILTLVIILTLWGRGISAQVNTNNGSGLANTYPTLADAITALNSAIITDPVEISLTGNEIAPVGGYVITAQGSAVNTIIIEGVSSTITAGLQVPGSRNDAVFKIVGGDYITLKNFTIQENLMNTQTSVATNTMTEWGVALLSDASRTNGAQNNTLLNNNIALNRNYSNSVGIYSSVLHLPADSPLTLTDITNTSGSNSYNQVYSNTISSVACPVVFVGSLIAADMDNSNEIGGSTSYLGNRFTNWGNNTANSIAANVSPSVFGVYCNNQVGISINNNTITSAVLSTTTDTRVIFVQYTGGTPTGSFSNAITSNLITLQNALSPATAYEVISTQGAVSATSTISINDNILQNCTTGGPFAGIVNASAPGTLNINRNIIKGTSSAATTPLFYGIRNSGAVVNTINILSNELGNSSGNLVTFSAATTGTFTGISNAAGAATCDLFISGNNFQGITLIAGSTSPHTYINNTAATLSQNISNNSFTSLSVNTIGDLTFISNSVGLPSGGSQTVNNNSIATSFTKTSSGGAITLYNSTAAGNANAVILHSLNNFSGITLTGATTMNGWVATGDIATSKTFSDNTFTNWTLGTGAVTVMNINSGTNTLSNNTITGITGAGAITGINTGSTGTVMLQKNTIGNFSTTGAVNVNGITSVTPFATLSGNKIYTISNTNAAGTVYGIFINGGTTTTLYNNIIGDLNATSSNSTTGLIGIYVLSGINFNAYYNTVWLSNGIGIGANFNSFAIYANTTTQVDLRNNIFGNISTASTAGFTVAYKRSNATLTSYAVTSNNNLFYAGSGPRNYIFWDGSNGYPTLALFKAWVGPTRDNASITENPTSTFSSTIGSDPTFLHINSVCSGTPTAIESGGIIVTPPLDDFDGDLRFGSAGYDGSGFAPDIGADEFNPQIVVVKASLGTTGPSNYTNLRTAFAKINDGTHKGNITIKLYCNTVETATAVLNASGNGNASYSSVMVYPALTGLSVSGNITSPLIDLSGASNVVIDGRVNQTGTTADLSIINTSANVNAQNIRFINSAVNNSIKYCKIAGANLSTTSGMVFFSTSSSGTGNSGNVVDHCELTNSLGSRPVNVIYSSGTASLVNTNNTISNNLFYNFFNLGTTSNGINIRGNSSAWNITGNSFYETTSFAPSVAVSYYLIRIDGTGGDNFNISGNFLGGSAAACSGAAWTKTVNSNNTFYGIYINDPTSTVCNIQGNTISNFSWTNSANADWTGIDIEAGSVNVGSTAGNIIGSAAGTGSIFVQNSSSSATNPNVIGIKHASASVGEIRNNSIGSITTASATTYPTNFYGIYKSNGNSVLLTISNNTIGSTLTALSVNASSATSVNVQDVFGIFINTAATVTITQNTIANLTNAYVGAGRIAGIVLQATGTTNTVNQNFIHNLVAPNSSLLVYGIKIDRGTGTFANNIISLGNDVGYGCFIYGISANNAAVSSIYFNTVYIAGTVSSGSNITYALNTNNISYQYQDYRDNILYNTRSGNGTSNYAISLPANTNVTINYNDYYTSSATFGIFNGTPKNLGGWQASTSQDGNSVYSNPVFTLLTGIIANEFKPGTTQNGITIAGITTDYNGSARGGTPVMGALEGNTIVTTSIAPGSACSGNAVTVNFSNVGTFIAGNVYTAQLSDASGGFSSPVLIGTLTSNASSGSIPAILPLVATSPTGVGYKIRVISSTPAVTNDAGTWLTVNLTPVVPAQTTTICSGTSPDFIPVDNRPTTIIPTGTTYTWTAPAVTGGITGGGAQATAQPSVNQPLTNPSNTAQTATYLVTPISLSGSCTGSAFTLVVTVNPKPAISAITPSTCNDIAFSITPANGTNGSIVPSGTTYSWSIPTMNGGITGGETGSGAADINGTLNNPGTAVQTAAYSVTPLSGNCTGSSFSVTVSVNPTPELTTITASACDGQAFSITDGSTVSGTSFSWNRAVVPGISNAAASGSSAVISETLLNTQTYNIPVTYAFTLSAYGCINPSHENLTVFVVPIPIVTASSTPSGGICPIQSSVPPFSQSMPFDLYSTSNLGVTQPSVLLAEDFEGGSVGQTSTPDGWTSSISVAGNATRWIIRNGLFTTPDVPLPFMKVTINSNTNDNFFIADNTPSLGVVSTSLISPVRDTRGYNTLTLDFWNYYRDKGAPPSYNDYGYIDASIDNGLTWNTITSNNPLRTFNETHGYPYSFAHETVDLSAYVGYANVRFRFRFEPSGDYYWAIDNITVTGTSPIPGFSWTSFPAGYTNNVNVSPNGLTQNGTTTYTAKYQDMSANCPGYASVTVTSFPAPTVPAVTTTPNNIAGQTVCSGSPITLTSSAAAGYRWNVNGSFMPGETNQSYVFSPAVNNNYSVTTSDANGCLATSNELIVRLGNVWTGTTNSNWGDAGNWSGTCGVPTSVLDAVIPNATTKPIVNINNAACNNLTIMTSSSLSIDPGKDLTVYGNLTNGGTLTINSDDLARNGSLIVSGSGSGKIVYNRYLIPNRWFITSAPIRKTVAGSFALQSGTTINNPGTYDLSPYTEANNSGWTYPYSALPDSLQRGNGYLVRLSAGSTLVFTGGLNSDFTLSLPSSNASYGWNAIGNPYPSALRITDESGYSGFITQNTGTLDPSYQAVYLWNQTGSYIPGVDQYYKVICNSGYVSSGGKIYTGVLPDKYVQAGQGFLVNLKYNGGSNGTIQFRKGTTINAGNDGMQVHSPTATTMKKSESSWPGITLIASANSKTRSTVVAFHEGMTTGLDPSYDAGLLSVSDFNLYTRLVSGGNETNFTIQCLPETYTDTLAIPVGIDMPQPGTITFKAAGVILPGGLYPVIEDRLLQLSAPLTSETDSAAFPVDEATWGIGRFYLHIGGGSVTTATNKLPETAKFTARFADHKITLFGTPEPGSRVWLYDVNGRQLSGEYRLTSANQNEIPAAGLASGIYLLKIEGKSGRQTLKITVLNR